MTNKRYRLLIVEDHPSMGIGTQHIAKTIPNIDVIGIAEDVERGIEAVKRLKPDIVILDFMLPDGNGLEMTRALKEIAPEMKIVIFTAVDYLPVYNRLIDAGISGLMPKDNSEAQIVNMIKCVIEDQAVIPMSLFNQLHLDSKEKIQPLTQDEFNIMTMVTRGFTNEQIAAEIYVSKRSVDNYLRVIYEKLGVANGVKMRPQAVQKFLEYTKEQSIV